jgi:hypothetical protein
MASRRVKIMPRFRIENGIKIQLTVEEEAEKNAEELEWAEEQAELAKTKYQRDRKAEYPPMEDYLDGIVKGDQTQIDKYISDCLAIKEKFPKE